MSTELLLRYWRARRWPRVLSAVTTLLVLGAAEGRGQTNTGEVAGVVRDAQGGVLPGVVVVAEHLASGARVERVSDEAVRYLLPLLRVGDHSVVAELSGFRRARRGGRFRSSA